MPCAISSLKIHCILIKNKSKYRMFALRKLSKITQTLLSCFSFNRCVIQSLLEENRQLKALMTCNIFMEIKTSIAMLPCGHLCSYIGSIKYVVIGQTHLTPEETFLLNLLNSNFLKCYL